MERNDSTRSGFFVRRILFSLVLCAIGVFLALIGFGLYPGASALAQDRRQNSGTGAKIAAQVLADTADGGIASVVVLLADQADVSAAYGIKDHDARGWFVYNTLSQHAARTQAGLRAFLETQGVSYQSFWVANMIVTTADRSLVESLAARRDVARVDSNNPTRWIEEPQVATFGLSPSSPAAPNVVEWGVANVNAPLVWALGFNGAGMVVGELDSGVRWTHNALKPKYRGWNGTSADHNFNWRDAIHTGGGVCGPNTVAPCDDNGHGTHTAGTTVGDDGSGNQVGVAPGAKWIGCRNMDEGNGTPATYTECFQFMIAPTDLAGNNPNPALRPHVINNSWTCTAGEGCVNRTELETIVNNTQAAGIFVDASAGNAGPGCSTVIEPTGIYNATFSVGAIDINNSLANFSSRGPSTYYTPPLLKPNLSAPGVNVRSTYSTNDSNYGNLSGTSMAAPHVAGVVALLWSARPELVRDIEATKSILQSTANPGVSAPAQTCGGTSSSQIPNNSFGYGRIDALAAVNAPAPTPTPSPSPTATPTASPTPSPTPTPTPTASPTPTATPTVTATATPTATAAPTATPTPTPPTVLANIATRLRVENADSTLIGGFIITGSQPKKIMVRAIGPSLSVADKLADPILELRDSSGALLEGNDNWMDSPNRQAIIDSTIRPSNDLESAIVRTLAPGAYTAIVRGVDNGTGIGVVEAYDLDSSADSKLANISSRGLVQTGDNVLIAGTIVVGQASQKVIIRALGPSVSVPGNMADPTLEVRDANGALLEANDNWQDSPNKQAIIDSGIAPTHDLESAIVRTLIAANYTAIVRGAGDTTGVAVVEIYALNSALPRPDHVVVVVMENKSYSQIIGSTQAPNINALAREAANIAKAPGDPNALSSGSHGLRHPSQPNYLELFSGSNQGVLGNGRPGTAAEPNSAPLPFQTPNLGASLIAGGFTFATYSQNLPFVGFDGDSYTTDPSQAQYERKHNPVANWQASDAPAQNHVPLTANQPFSAFPTDAAGYAALPTISFVVPDQQNDMHDGSIAQGDAWLKTNILDRYYQWAKTHNSLLILTFDEDSNNTASNHITTIFAGPMIKPGTYYESNINSPDTRPRDGRITPTGTALTHYNVLRTLVEMYGLAPIGSSRNTAPVTDIFLPSP